MTCHNMPPVVVLRRNLELRQGVFRVMTACVAQPQVSRSESSARLQPDVRPVLVSKGPGDVSPGRRMLDNRVPYR